MRRVVIDTNVYIDWLNAGRYEAVLFEADAVKYLSAVVLMELYAGTFSPRDIRLVRGIASAFKRADRILVPTGQVYEDAGEVLRGLQSAGFRIEGRHSLVNDILIALSARSIGATVFTQNERDFAIIHRIRPFKLAIVPTV
ncbi:MAG: type II toxin-antitoxin system VapC family toxin [Candidatus Rokuibacteriota bacterium]